MATEWHDVAVDDLKAPSESALATGPFGSSIGSRFFVASGVPVIRGANLSEDVGIRLNEKGLVFLSPEKARDFARSTVRKGDLIFTCWGTVGQVGLIDKRSHYREYVISNKQMKLTPDSTKADSLFLYYLFSGPEMQQRIQRESIGSSVPGFNLGHLRAMRVRLPGLKEQCGIARILGDLDDKIELNHRMRETLETMTRAIFASWFVNFDPARAMVDRRAAGLTDSLSRLFPNRLEDTQCGKVPTGWQLVPLVDHVDAERGLSYKGSGLSESGVPLHNLNSVYEGGGYKHEGIKYYTGEFAERHRVRAGDLLVANTEQGHDRLLIGYAAIVPASFGEHSILSHHLYRVRPKRSSPFTGQYLCHLFNSPAMHDRVSRYANGTTVNMLPIDALQRPDIVLPPAPLVHAFNEIATKCSVRCEELVEESRTLRALRDALLPKLVSGELRVKDAGRFVEHQTV